MTQQGHRYSSKKNLLDELERILGMNRKYLSFSPPIMTQIPEEQFIYTLTATDIYSGWTELIPIRNKAMVWTMQILKEIVKEVPVKIKKYILIMEVSL